MFCPESFMGSGFTFKSFIQLNLFLIYLNVFLYMVLREWSNFFFFFFLFFFHVSVQFSQQHLLKRDYYHTVYSGLLCHRLIYHITSFWALCSIPLINSSVFIPVLQCYDYGSFIVQQFEIRKLNTSHFVFSQNFFGYSRFFVVPYKFYQDQLF